MLVLVLKGEVEGEKSLEDMGRAGMKDRGSRIDYLCLQKTPCTQPCYMQSAQSILFFYCFGDLILQHMYFPFALEYLYLSFKISFLITKITFVYDKTECK